MSNNENIPSNDQQEPNSEAVPFFVRYLEGQLEELSEEEAESVGGGFPCAPEMKELNISHINENLKDLNFEFPFGAATLKYPSDHEDGSSHHTAVTLKYPSDNEDGGMMTKKYPSDNDE